MLANCDFICRAATRIVLSASIVFVVLMIPRGVSYMLIALEPSREIWRSDAHTAVDMVFWWLQYVNHSVNFFIYVVASKQFRLRS